jgi:hypothetical protein
MMLNLETAYDSQPCNLEIQPQSSVRYPPITAIRSGMLSLTSLLGHQTSQHSYVP